jgi:hypothetical protein
MSMIIPVLIPDRVHRKATSNLGLKSHVQKVLFLLVESGVIFLGLQVSFDLISCTVNCATCLTYHVLVSKLVGQLVNPR